MRQGRIERPRAKPVIPAPEAHYHEECQHWCHGQACRMVTTQALAEDKCRACRLKDFNDRAVKGADPAVRNPEGTP